MRRRAGDRHRVALVELCSRTHSVDGVGFCFLALVGAVLNLRAPAPAAFQCAEVARQAVVVFLVRQDDDVRAEARELLVPVGDDALQLAVGVKARSIRPVQPVVGI